MKKIFVPFMSEGVGKASFKAAYHIAQEFGADIDVCHMREEPYVAFPYAVETAVVYSDKTLQKIEEYKKERAQELKGTFNELYEHYGRLEGSSHQVSAGWIEKVGRPDIEFGRTARCVDLVVTARVDTEEGDREQPLVEHLLLSSGTPLVVANPHESSIFETQALIAWNGSLEASRALRAAVPFLSKVRSVSILTLGRLPSNVPGPDVVRSYLEAQGIDSDYEALEKFNGSVEEAIEDYAKSEGCGLVVMGAYSHSRLREFVLGGATRHMLRDTEFALLLSH